MRIVCLVVVAGVLVLAGCGGDSDADQVRDLAQQISTAADEGDAESFCDAFAEGALPVSCESVADAVVEGEESIPAVTSVEVNDDGTATVSYEDDTEITAERIDGEWKLTDIGGG